MPIVNNSTYLTCDVCKKAYGPYSGENEALNVRQAEDSEWFVVNYQGKSYDVCCFHCGENNLVEFLGEMNLANQRKRLDYVRPGYSRPYAALNRANRQNRPF